MPSFSKNIFIVALSVGALSLFTSNPADAQPTQPQGNALDTFNQQLEKIQSPNIKLEDLTEEQRSKIQILSKQAQKKHASWKQDSKNYKRKSHEEVLKEIEESRKQNLEFDKSRIQQKREHMQNKREHTQKRMKNRKDRIKKKRDKRKQRRGQRGDK